MTKAKRVLKAEAFLKATDYLKNQMEITIVVQCEKSGIDINRMNRLRHQGVPPSPGEMEQMELAFPGFKRIYEKALEGSDENATLETISENCQEMSEKLENLVLEVRDIKEGYIKTLRDLADLERENRLAIIREYKKE